jgi:hypothetical protein
MIDRYILAEMGMFVPVIRSNGVVCRLEPVDTLYKAQKRLGMTWDSDRSAMMYAQPTPRDTPVNKRDWFILKLRSEDEALGNVQHW